MDELEKWLPRGKFQGRTIVQYKVHGHKPLPREQIQNHHLALQPYVQSIQIDHHDSAKFKIIYDSVDPSSISLFASQFKYLIRDATFYQLNPEADLQHEVMRGDDGSLYARIFDANLQGED